GVAVKLGFAQVVFDGGSEAERSERHGGVFADDLAVDVERAGRAVYGDGDVNPLPGGKRGGSLDGLLAIMTAAGDGETHLAADVGTEKQVMLGAVSEVEDAGAFGVGV